MAALAPCGNARISSQSTTNGYYDTVVTAWDIIMLGHTMGQKFTSEKTGLLDAGPDSYVMQYVSIYSFILVIREIC